MKSYKTNVYGHRGASEYAPENSMEAFKLAYDMGADGIEFDVQLSKDGQIVVIHDETIDRTSNATGYIRDYTLDELRTFDFNNNKENFNNIKIPLLVDVLKEFENKEFLLNIELKNNILPYPTLEEKVLELVEQFEFIDNTIFSSFSHSSMVYLKSLRPDAKIAFLYSNKIVDVTDYLQKFDISIANPSEALCGSKSDIELFHNNNQQVNVWTVNYGSVMRKLFDMGVDGIITNKPDLAVEIKNDVR